MGSIKEWIPWYAKIVAKLLIARLPGGYNTWRKIGLFTHGAMNNPEYAHKVFQLHFQRCDFPRKGGGFVALEMGPGDSLFSALLAKVHGASKSYLVDSGEWAINDLASYREMLRFLESQKFTVTDIETGADIAGILERCNASYGTKGLSSLREVPTGSVDFVFSQAVLEHIRANEFLETMQEVRRILRPDGICSHQVDLKDHLGGTLNNLRVGSGLWEGEWMAGSGFYTNRLRYSEMLALFRKAGFETDVVATNRWEVCPTPRKAFAREFQGLCDNDLLVKEFDVLLRAR